MAEAPLSVRVKFTAYSGLVLLSTVIVALFASLVTTVATRAAVADERGGLIFEELCTECHTIGGGFLQGPDLEGVNSRREKDWLINWIMSPKRMIASGDPIALQLVREAGKDTKVMPDHLQLSVEQIEWILAYIEVQGAPVPVQPAPGAPVPVQPAPGAPVPVQPAPGAPVPVQPAPGAPVPVQPAPGAPVPVQPAPGAPVPVQPAPGAPVPVQPAKPAVVATAGDTNKGRDIFMGKAPLANGGVACISCHNVDGVALLGGGSFAVDITNVLGGKGLNEKGLISVLSKTPFPIMKAVFGSRPLEKDEITNLVAFLKESSTAGKTVTNNGPFLFVVFGITGLLLIAMIIQVLWRGRLSGVRQSLVKGGPK